MMGKTHSELEAILASEGREWVRLLLEEVLDRRAQLEERREVNLPRFRGRSLPCRLHVL